MPANGTRTDPRLVYESISDDVKSKMNWNRGNRFAEFGQPGKGNFKSALLSERGHRCEKCLNTEWLGQQIAIELDHVDGNRQNNTRENLKLLCPNCHAQTPTWRRSEKKGFKVQKYTDEEMIEAIRSSRNLNQVLEKLNLRYGSAGTIIKVLNKYRVEFLD